MSLGLEPMIDRFGAKTMLLLTTVVVFVHAFLLAGTQALWSNNTYVLFMLSFWVLLLPVTMVCVIALAMTVCRTRVSATQFAVYMSTANLGVSMGSKLYGSVSEYASFAQNYALMGTLVVIMAFIVAIFRRHEQLLPAT